MYDIVNKDNIKPGLDPNDIKDLERRMVEGGIIQPKSRSTVDRFQEEIAKEASKLGINFDGFPKSKPTALNPLTQSSYSPYSPSSPSSPSSQSSNRQRSNVDYPKGTYPKDTYPKDTYSKSMVMESEYTPEDEQSEEGGGESGSNHSDESDDSDYTPTTNRFSAPSYEESRETPHEHSQTTQSPQTTQYRTYEQERRSHIDTVMGAADANHLFEREKREDMKCAMLAEIDSLKHTLENYDVNLENIPKVNRSSEFSEIESVLKILRYKNDNSRYCDFAEEFLLFGAYTLEDLFDGKRMWLGRYQPDLTGWHNNVNVKLKRMRHDTGQLVSGVMQDYNIGPGARICLELIPNLVLYSKMKKQQHSQPGLFIDAGDEEMEQAKSRIRDINGD
jgi:hypothetical protein